MRYLLRLSPAEILLRLSIALAFLYPPIDAIWHADAWVGYFPSFLTDTLVHVGILPIFLLHAFGIVEVAIALWIVFGKRILVPSLLAATILILIVLFNLPSLELLFRDVAIALAALSLAMVSWRKGARSGASA